MNEAPWNEEKDKIGQLPNGIDPFFPNARIFLKLRREFFLKLRWELNDDPLDVF